MRKSLQLPVRAVLSIQSTWLNSRYPDKDIQSVTLVFNHGYAVTRELAKYPSSRTSEASHSFDLIFTLL